MDINEALKTLTPGVIVALALIAAVVIVIIPLILRLSGLSGAQILELLTSTLQFFVSLVKEFRTQNSNRP